MGDIAIPSGGSDRTEGSQNSYFKRMKNLVNTNATNGGGWFPGCILGTNIIDVKGGTRTKGAFPA